MCVCGGGGGRGDVVCVHDVRSTGLTHLIITERESGGGGGGGVVAGG